MCLGHSQKYPTERKLNTTGLYAESVKNRKSRTQITLFISWIA